MSKFSDVFKGFMGVTGLAQEMWKTAQQSPHTQAIKDAFKSGDLLKKLEQYVKINPRADDRVTWHALADVLERDFSSYSDEFFTELSKVSHPEISDAAKKILEQRKKDLVVNLPAELDSLQCRFTSRAAHAIRLMMKNDRLGTASRLSVYDLLLALYKEGSGIAATIIKQMMDVSEIKKFLDFLEDQRPEISAKAKLTGALKRAGELSILLNVNNVDYIGTEHLLLGVLDFVDPTQWKYATKSEVSDVKKAIHELIDPPKQYNFDNAGADIASSLIKMDVRSPDFGIILVGEKALMSGMDIGSLTQTADMLKQEIEHAVKKYLKGK